MTSDRDRAHGRRGRRHRRVAVGAGRRRTGCGWSASAGAGPARQPAGRPTTSAGTPAGDCVTARRPLILIGRDEIRSRYPDLETAAEGERSMVCLPLLVGDRALGAATMSFPGRRDVRRRRAGVLQRHGRHLRAGPRPGAGPRRRGRPGRQAARSWPTPPTSWRSSLDYESTLTNVARLAVP